MATSKLLFVYLQRPDTGDWVTVGRYKLRDDGIGLFMYAPSYASAGLSWSIDPVNLPFLPGVEQVAHRYRGLHDVLRDACPDSWGRLLLQREHNLGSDTHDSVYLRLAKNSHRWGALAVGASRTPSIDHLKSPALPQLALLSQELLAIYERRPPVDLRVRRALMATPSLGGARPKGTLQDGDDYWLVKPVLPGDAVDIPILEHATQQWGSAAGLNFAQSVHDRVESGLSVLRSLRYDRYGTQRSMVISGASLLGTEYPGATRIDAWSYPLLAQELKRIGAPSADTIELFDRMVFNAVIGNDDDHPRNHAALYHGQEQCWRLSPAYDVVPNAEEQPRTLAMQVSSGRFDIARDAVLADAKRFGFEQPDHAAGHLDALLVRIAEAFPRVQHLLDGELRRLMAERLSHGLAVLGRPSK